MSVEYPIEMIHIDLLKPHPKNPRTHPDEQIELLGASIDAHGFYKNIVIARDNTILAGHGAVRASREKGLQQIPVHRVDVDPDSVAAWNIMVSDNRIAQLSHTDSRGLEKILQKAGRSGEWLDNELRRTRHRLEVPDTDRPTRLILSFTDNQARMDFYAQHFRGQPVKPDGLKWAVKLEDAVEAAHD